MNKKHFTNIIFILVLLVFSPAVEAQLVNIEKSRKEARPGLQGHIDLNLMLTRNTRQILETTTTAHLQYNWDRHMVLALNNLGFMRVEGSNVINNGFQHLRYNYMFNEGFTTMELLAQHQYNAIRLLQTRILFGGGPRFRVYENDNTSLFIAPLVMYEYEVYDDEDNTITSKFKGNLYASFFLELDERVNFTHTTYYQPDFSFFRDFRLSSETGLELLFTGSFSFLVIFHLNYDSDPPGDIPGLFYTLRNGIKYNF